MEGPPRSSILDFHPQRRTTASYFQTVSSHFSFREDNMVDEDEENGRNRNNRGIVPASQENIPSNPEVDQEMINVLKSTQPLDTLFGKLQLGSEDRNNTHYLLRYFLQPFMSMLHERVRDSQNQTHLVPFLLEKRDLLIHERNTWKLVYELLRGHALRTLAANIPPDQKDIWDLIFSRTDFTQCHSVMRWLESIYPKSVELFHTRLSSHPKIRPIEGEELGNFLNDENSRNMMNSRSEGKNKSRTNESRFFFDKIFQLLRGGNDNKIPDLCKEFRRTFRSETLKTALGHHEIHIRRMEDRANKLLNLSPSNSSNSQMLGNPNDTNNQSLKERIGHCWALYSICKDQPTSTPFLHQQENQNTNHEDEDDLGKLNLGSNGSPQDMVLKYTEQMENFVYAILSGHLSQTHFPLKTWEDLLWAHLRCYTGYHINQVISQTCFLHRHSLVEKVLHYQSTQYSNLPHTIKKLMKYSIETHSHYDTDKEEKMKKEKEKNDRKYELPGFDDDGLEDEDDEEDEEQVSIVSIFRHIQSPLVLGDWCGLIESISQGLQQITQHSSSSSSSSTTKNKNLMVDEKDRHLESMFKEHFFLRFSVHILLLFKTYFADPMMTKRSNYEFIFRNFRKKESQQQPQNESSPYESMTEDYRKQVLAKVEVVFTRYIYHLHRSNQYFLIPYYASHIPSQEEEEDNVFGSNQQQSNEEERETTTRNKKKENGLNLSENAVYYVMKSLTRKLFTLHNSQVLRNPAVAPVPYYTIEQIYQWQDDLITQSILQKFDLNKILYIVLKNLLVGEAHGEGMGSFDREAQALPIVKSHEEYVKRIRALEWCQHIVPNYWKEWMRHFSNLVFRDVLYHRFDDNEHGNRDTILLEKIFRTVLNLGEVWSAKNNKKFTHNIELLEDEEDEEEEEETEEEEEEKGIKQKYFSNGNFPSIFFTIGLEETKNEFLDFQDIFEVVELQKQYLQRTIFSNLCDSVFYDFYSVIHVPPRCDDSKFSRDDRQQQDGFSLNHDYNKTLLEYILNNCLYDGVERKTGRSRRKEEDEDDENNPPLRFRKEYLTFYFKDEEEGSESRRRRRNQKVDFFKFQGNQSEKFSEWRMEYETIRVKLESRIQKLITRRDGLLSFEDLEEEEEEEEEEEGQERRPSPPVDKNKNKRYEELRKIRSVVIARVVEFYQAFLYLEKKREKVHEIVDFEDYFFESVHPDLWKRIQSNIVHSYI